RGFLGCALRRCLLRRDLLRRDLLGDRLLRSESAARRLAGFLQQARHLLERQRGRLAVLRDLVVESAVADLWAKAAVEHLDVAAVELLDPPVARDLFLLVD